ncbi:MAG: YihY family inner membrane protein [Myxococcota bacterium]
MSGTAETLSQVWRRVTEFWNRDMWRVDRLSGTPPMIGGLLIILSRSLWIIVDAFQRDRIRLRAATLTFVTLLSLVPLLAVAFSLFTAFGGLQEVGDRVKALVVDALAVQQRDVVNQYLDQFIEGANAGGLGAVGSITLFVTAVSTMSNIETAFNDIWGVTQARGWIRRFQVYLPVVLLGPALFGYAFSSIVAAQGSDTVKALLEQAPFLRFVFDLGPIVAYVLLFFVLYAFLPNTRVRWIPALAGGLVAGVLWVIAQRLFTVYAARAISYSAIYGSFGAVPITILWIYVSWTLVLLGATVSFAVQSARTFEPERDVQPREREQIAARLILAVSERFMAGAGPMAAQELIDDAGVPPRVGRRILEELVDAQLLVKALLPDEETGYTPGRPLDSMSLGDVVSALRGEPNPPPSVERAQKQALVLLNEAAVAEQGALRRHSLLALVADKDLS